MSRQLGALIPSSKALHDASTGFRDIKPLPEFSPLDLPLLLGILLVAIILLGVWWYRRTSRRTPQVSPPLPAHDVARAKLEQLLLLWESQSISLRELSHRLSMTLRAYLAKRLEFPAEECTVREVNAALPCALTEHFCHTPTQEQMHLAKEVDELLRLFERLSFAENTENLHTGDCIHVAGAVERIENIVQSIESWREREALENTRAEKQQKTSRRIPTRQEENPTRG